MKKLTSLQTLMLMSLALGSSSIYSKTIADMNDRMQEAVTLELQAANDEDAKLNVLQDLAQADPEKIRDIIQDEKDLEATFDSIRIFVKKLNEKIEKAFEDSSVDAVQVAQWASEAADAQENFNKATARQRVESKSKNKYEQVIKNAIKKAVENLSVLNQRAVELAQQAQQVIGKAMRKVKKSKAAKAVVKASSNVKRAAEYSAAQAARYIPGVQDQVAQNLAAKLNVSQEEANDIINNTFEQDAMAQQKAILPDMQDNMDDDFVDAEEQV